MYSFPSLLLPNSVMWHVLARCAHFCDYERVLLLLLIGTTFCPSRMIKFTLTFNSFSSHTFTRRFPSCIRQTTFSFSVINYLFWWLLMISAVLQCSPCPVEVLFSVQFHYQAFQHHMVKGRCWKSYIIMPTVFNRETDAEHKDLCWMTL